MTQAYEKLMEMKSIEFEVIPEAYAEVDELLGVLNPRYFEEGMYPEEALQKVHSMEEFNNYMLRPF
ncbi:MAG: hypothetical protein ACXAEX_07265 [Promethearchaeota archaeon]